MPFNPTPQNPPKYQLLGIPDGTEGVRATLEIMRRMVRAARTSQEIRELALALTERLEQKDFMGEIEALHRFVRDSIRYVQDVNEVETVAPPSEILRLRAGDCDDKCTLLAALLESIGHPARFAAVAFEPDNFSHVIVETRIGAGWLPLECTEPVEAGWSPEGVVSKMLRHI